MVTTILLVCVLFPADVEKELPVEASTAVDFENDVIPVLTKAGCNTGACHGAAVGRGGFKLSLYGGDPSADYESIVLELRGRRVNLHDPRESLLVLKPTESIEHGGGYRFDFDEPATDLLLSWIEQGTSKRSFRKLHSVEVAPKRTLMDRTGESFQLSVTAKFDDGSHRDVTQWTVFTPEDDSAITVDPPSAVATVHRRGRHIVVARYLSQVVPVEIIVPLTEQPLSIASDPQNFIDEHTLRLLQTLRLPVSPQADDFTFLRRISLSLTGRLPTPEDVHEFASNRSDQRQKRADIVRKLLNSEEFVEYWTLQLAKLLRIQTQPQDKKGALTYHEWLKRQVAEGTPYDQFAREVINAEGDSHEFGPANFYRTVGGAREQAEFMSELFMGSRLRCANCHNHPLDRWTQDDYHGLAAIFAKIQSGRIVSLNPSGEVTHPRTGENAVARIPGGRFIKDAIEARGELAEWLTQSDNPFFAKAIVNRLWKAMLGRGLVEPADDLRATNPATHPELLDRLAQDFVEHGYSLRHTLELIANSQTYARSAHALVENASDDRFYSHALSRPLEPEVLADAISDVLDVAEKYGQEPLGTRAVSLFDPATESAALDILGRCSRDETCETTMMEASGGLPLKLHMFNGALLNKRLAAPNSRLNQLINGGADDEEIVEEFYLRAFGRFPSQEEQEFWRGQCEQAQDKESRVALLQDFVWSVLTCDEFVTNH